MGRVKGIISTKFINIEAQHRIILIVSILKKKMVLKSHNPPLRTHLALNLKTRARTKKYN